MAVGAAEPRLEWSFETKGKIYASPILADLDGDGLVEVIVAASRDKRLLCLSSRGELRWDYRWEDNDADGLQSTPSVVDYDGDGKKEIFFASRGGVVGCVDYQGRPVWRTFLGDTIDYNGPVVADVDGDGRIEVLIGSDSGTVYCLDDSGMKRWHYQGSGQIRGIPAVARVGDETTMRIYVVFGNGVDACLSSAGKLLWAHEEPAPRGFRRSGPALGDVDGDGALEVMTATEDFQIIVRDALTGDEEWRWAGKSGTDQTHSFALAHVDNPELLDIFCGDGTGQTGGGHLHRFSNGKRIWTIDPGGAIVQGPSIGDVDGDGELEVLVCSRSKRILCLSIADGAEEWSYPSETEMLTTPALGDIDGDGQVEIVYTSKDRYIYCLTLDGAYDPSKLPWPMLSHDPQLSANYANQPFVPEPAAKPTQTPEFSLSQFGPIHFGENQVEVQVTNNSPRPRHLEAVVGVRLPDGVVINRTFSGRFEPLEQKQFTVTFPALTAGAYALGASLLDVGQGRTVATDRKESGLDLDAPMNTETANALAAGPELVAGLPAGPAQARVAAACEQSKQAYDGALAAAKAAALNAEASLDERRAAVDALAAAGNEVVRAVSRAHALRLTPGAGLEFAVISTTTLNKVFNDEPLFTAYDSEAGPAAIALCGNEYESSQIVVVPQLSDLTNLRVSIAGDLTSADGAAIPAANVEVTRVGYVGISPPEYTWFVEKVGEYPDVLFPNAPIDVAGERDAQPFFVTVKTEAGTSPGDYAGVVRVEADGVPAVNIPLNVHVWGFSLTDETHLKTSFWMNEGYINRFYGFEGRAPFDVRKRFYDCHLDHRVSPIKDFPIGGGDMIEDFDYLMANGQNCMFIPVPHYLEESERPAFAEKLKLTYDLLEEKGWNDYVMFYSLDEVAVVQRHMIDKMVEMNTWVKDVVPQWPRLETSAPEEALFGAVDIWCPTIDSFDPNVLARRMAKGERLWFYTVWGRPGIMIEFPQTDYRLMFWQCRKYGAEGFLYWGTTHWGFNCEGDERWPGKPWITHNAQPGHNGCGYLIYPGPDGTPLPSVRLHIVRDGIEDYEYFHLLDRLLAEAGDSLPDGLRQRALAAANVPDSVVHDNKVFTEDAGLLLQTRQNLATVIEEVWAAVRAN
ncbi:MAG: DUF4091 domain-containing protein [Nitrospiraceae bacterium]|nr:DUF4091 domain-containing protein [Nitrospiraceae bacterium]